MNTSAKAVRFDHSRPWVTLADGRTLAVPLAWLSSGLNAAPDEQWTKFAATACVAMPFTKASRWQVCWSVWEMGLESCRKRLETGPAQMCLCLCLWW